MKTNLAGMVLASALALDGEGWVKDVSPIYEQNADGYLTGASGRVMILNNAFGYSMAPMGDVDGDGVEDYLIGSPTFAPDGGWGNGRVELVSGKTLESRYAVVGDQGNALGRTLAVIGDLDKDMVPDFVTAEMGCGSAYAYSGKSGARLFELWGSGEYTCYYSTEGTFAAAGDVNQDGYPDILSGNPFFSQGAGIHQGIVVLSSGKDGALIGLLPGKGAGDFLGCALEGGMDVDGDGNLDFIATAARGNVDYRSISEHNPEVRVYDGKSGRLLYEWSDGGTEGDENRNFQKSNYGYSLAFLGDINGDKASEVLVGAPGLRHDDMLLKGHGVVYCYDGRTGKELFAWQGEEIIGAVCPDYLQEVFQGRLGEYASLGGFGASLAACSDQDGDGLRDVIVGFVGRIDHYSGVFVLSTGSGGVVAWFANHALRGSLRGVGAKVEECADRDGDGIRDILFNAVPREFGAAVEGRVFIASPRSSRILDEIVAGATPLVGNRTFYDPAGETAQIKQRQSDH